MDFKARKGGFTARSVWIGLAGALLFAGGCEKGGPKDGQVEVFPIAGTVTFEGQPLARAVITLTPAKSLHASRDAASGQKRMIPGRQRRAVSPTTTEISSCRPILMAMERPPANTW